VIAGTQQGAPKEYARRLLELPNAPTAVVAVSDSIAAEVTEIAPEMGFEIPTDLSLTGFDDVNTHLVSSLNLTTVHVDQLAQARSAVDILLTHEPSNSKRIERRIQTQLICRAASPNPATRSSNVSIDCPAWLQCSSN
jgi:LacI family transcriptional regulator